jgi:hypothetical protein
VVGTASGPNCRLVNESRVAWLLRVEVPEPDAPLAVKIARPKRGSACGVPVGLDTRHRNAFIRKEVAARERLRGNAHVAPVLETGRHRGLDFFATRWIEAESSTDPGSPGAAAEALAVARALIALHAHGIVHGDLEPHHVLVADEVVWLVDFGSAVFLDEDARAGAIERDLFSMGGYLAERLLGLARFPYHSRHEVPYARALAERLPPSPSGRVVARALATWTGTDQPYRSAAELEWDLREALIGSDSEHAPRGELSA